MKGPMPAAVRAPMPKAGAVVEKMVDDWPSTSLANVSTAGVTEAGKKVPLTTLTGRRQLAMHCV